MKKTFAAAFAAASLLFALVLAGRTFAERRPLLRADLDVAHVELGEALRLAAHPASVNPAYRLPWASVLEADAFLRVSPRVLAAVTAAFWLLAFALLFALGRELGGTAAGAGAVALWAPVFAALPRGPGTNKQFWLTFLGLSAAVLWTRRGAWPAGACFGLTLLTRGTWAFFPPCVAAVRRDRASLAFAGAALAFLLPWVAMNALSRGRFVPLEDGAMNMNVVTGALGTVFCAHGDYSALMGGSGEGGGSPLLWAAQTVAAEPGRYLGGVARRLARAFSLQPWLFLLAGAALLLRRRDPGARALALMAAYFLLVTCAMSIEDNYFEPLWPLLAALAASPLAALPEAAPRAGAAAARAALAAALCFSAFMCVRLFAYMARYGVSAARRAPSSDAALDAALDREPRSPWLALSAARRALSRGDAAGAAAALESAAELEGLPRRDLLLAWARAKGGEPRPLLEMKTPPRDLPSPFGDPLAESLAVYQALALDGLGRRPEALAALRRAVAQWEAWQGFLNPGREAAADALAPRLKAASYGRFLVRLDQILEGQSPADLERAVELAAVAQEDPEAWRRLFESRLSRGEKDAAAAALRAREQLLKERESRRQAAFDWERLGRPADAAASFARVLREDGPDARTETDYGVALYKSGRRAEAEKAFRRALALDPAFEPARLSLDVVRERRDPARR